MTTVQGIQSGRLPNLVTNGSVTLVTAKNRFEIDPDDAVELVYRLRRQGAVAAADDFEQAMGHPHLAVTLSDEDKHRLLAVLEDWRTEENVHTPGETLMALHEELQTVDIRE